MPRQFSLSLPLSLLHCTAAPQSPKSLNRKIEIPQNQEQELADPPYQQAERARGEAGRPAAATWFDDPLSAQWVKVGQNYNVLTTSENYIA